MEFLNIFIDFFIKSAAVTSGIVATASLVLLILIIVGFLIRDKKPNKK